MSDPTTKPICATCVRLREGFCDGEHRMDKGACDFYKRMTNADRIRAMTDEKLAQWLTFIEEKILAIQPSVSRSELFADWFDWLKQEVEE